VQERGAVLTALDRAGKPLVMWKLSESSKIGQSRLHGVLAVLVREGAVKRVEAPDAVRYSRG
jgi:DNA-binding IclR family transcriptional regulator